MKSKYMLGIFLILLMATTACVYAADAKIDDDYKFTVPDGYNVTEHGDDFAFLEGNGTYAIRISPFKSMPTADALANQYKAGGFDVKEQDTISENGSDIVFVHFIDKEDQIYVYVWKVDGKDCVMAVYGYPESDPATAWADSPVKEIHDSIVKI